MQTIVLNSQKGGSGKTTLCAGLAVEAARGKRVCLIDTDAQGTLTHWHEQREAENPFRVNVPVSQMKTVLKELEQRGTDYTFIDTAPSITPETAAIIRLASLVVVPVLPSPADVWAVIPTVELLKESNTRFIFVLNKVKANTRLTTQAAVLLSHYGAVAQAMISDRVDYAAALTDGRTGAELNPKGKASDEIKALWRSAQKALNATSQRRETVHA